MTELRDRAVALRAEGQTIGAIARELGVPKSTAGRWLRGTSRPEPSWTASRSRGEERRSSRRVATARVEHSPTTRTAQAIPPENSTGIPVAALRKLFSTPAPTSESRTRFGRSLNLDRIELALRDAEQGRMRELTDLEYETLNVDPHLAAVLAKRIGALATLDYDVLPADGTGIDPEIAAEIAAHVRNQLACIAQFQQSIRQLAWGLYHGRAALEIMWRVPKKNGEPHRVECLKWVHPRRLAFGPERELRLDDSWAVRGFSTSGVALRDFRYKFVEFMPQLFGDYPEREGLAPRALYWSFFKRFANRERMILVELFGKPWRIIEVDAESDASAEDLEAADEAAQKLGGANTARMPRGTQLNVVSPSRAAGQIHQEVVEEADRQISKLVLGQTATTEGGGTVPGADGMLRGEQLMILQQDAHLVSEAIESFLTDAIVAVNFGEEFLDHAPKFKLRSEIPADKRSELDRLKASLEAGLEVSRDEAYKLSGFSIPEAGDVIVKIEQPPAHPTAVQPPPPRPIIVYPPAKAPDPGEVQSIPSSGEGGLDSPEEAPEPPPPPAPPPTAPPSEDEPPADASFHPGGKVTLAALKGAGLDEVDSLELALAVVGSSPWQFDVDDQVCLSRQPSTVFGSPETLIAAGVEEGVEELARWIEQYATAAAGKESAREVVAALRRVHLSISRTRFEAAIEKRLVHGAMLGALDSAFEVESGEQVEAVDLQLDELPKFTRLEFEEAVREFLRREVMTKEAFDALSAEMKRQAFAVAGAANDELLRLFRAELARQIGEGGQLREFEAFVRERATKAGWTPSNSSHVETIYRTNVVDSYGGGRFAHARQPEVMAERDYWQIRTVRDARQRRDHGKAHGKVLRADDPFWHTAYPPFGFNCRCRVTTLSESQLKRRGLEVSTGDDLPRLPDRGFSSGRR